jgi:fucose permease
MKNEIEADTTQLQEYYHLTFVVISLVFLSPLVGYTASALLNNSIHLKFGQRGVAMVSDPQTCTYAIC